MTAITLGPRALSGCVGTRRGRSLQDGGPQAGPWGTRAFPNSGPPPSTQARQRERRTRKRGGGEAKQAGRPQARGGLGRLGEGRRRAEGARGEGF